MDFELLKGTKDFEPKEQIRINFILDIIRNNFELYGFRPFDTPIIEFMKTLTFKYEEDAEIVEEIFKIVDRGNRDLGLRYDLTTPLSRFIASKKQLKLPFKRYQIGKVFRDGPIKKGRLREFIQCDGDVIGQSGVEIEIELLNLFYKTYLDLNINSIIELNNNKILRGAFLQVGFKEENLSSLILSVDKLKKIGEDYVLKEIDEKGLDSSLAKKAIRILNNVDFRELRKIANNEVLLKGIVELEELVEGLKKMNINFRLNFSMSRGLDIYTGNIWEVYDLDESISSSLGSGGRYDEIIGEYSGDGRNISAVGISFGLIPIMAVLENNNEEYRNSLTEILIVPLNKDLSMKALEIANKFRELGNNTEVFFEYKLKKAFSYCDNLDIKKIVVLGSGEIENNEFKLKDLSSREEEVFKLEEFLKKS